MDDGITQEVWLSCLADGHYELSMRHGEIADSIALGSAEVDTIMAGSDVHVESGDIKCCIASTVEDLTVKLLSSVPIQFTMPRNQFSVLAQSLLRHNHG